MKSTDDYAAVANEINNGSIDAAAWTMAFATEDGNEDRTKAAYIRLRVREIASLRMPMHWRRWRWKAASILLSATALAFIQIMGRVADLAIVKPTGNEAQDQATADLRGAMCFIAFVISAIFARKAWKEARGAGGETIQRWVRNTIAVILTILMANLIGNLILLPILR